MDAQGLTEFLDEVYEVDLYGPGVRFSHHPVECYGNNIPDDFLNRVEINKVDNEGIQWNLSLGEYEGHLGSITSGSKTIKEGEKYKHRHEFVCQGIQLGETDMPLSLIKRLDDDDDYRTPDFILVTDNIIHVIEVGTCINNREDIVYKHYDTKEFSYLSAIQNRFQGEKIITFTIIIVTPFRIISSVKLPEIICIELLARMRIGIALESKAELLGLDLGDDERSEFKKTIQNRIEKAIQTEFRLTSDNPLLIDEDYIKSCLEPSNETMLIKDLITEMVDTRINIEKQNLLENELQTNNYIEQFSKGNRRYDKKMVVIFPWINIEEKDPSSEIPKLPINDTEELSTVSKLWSHAMDYYELSPHKEQEDPQTLLNEALSEDPGEVRQFEDERKMKRRHYHRVDLKNVLSNEDLETLSRQGLWAKKFKNDDFMTARRLHQQSGFSWKTDVNDIENFLSDNYGLMKAKVKEDIKIKLLKKSNNLAGNSSKAIDILTQWRETQFFQSLEIISDIAYEIAISNKQHCKPKEMIMKKLRNYEIYILISPTNSSEHTFFSLYIPKPASMHYNGVFGRTYNCVGGFFTDFVSIKQSKLENQSSMPASLISLASFWSWFYDLPDASPHSFSENSEAYYMLKFSILIRLEDKAQTEETITYTRYMYMEIFKSFFSINNPNPLKILDKLTNYPRSRLNLFCIKKIILNFNLMLRNPPTRVLNQDPQLLEEGEDSVPNDCWNNLLNWVNGKQISTATKAINLVYLGYLKNKMESPEGNTDFQLVEKTCEEEFKLNWSEISKSKGVLNGDKPKEKQFSKNAIMHGTDVLIERLKNMFGRDWRMVIKKDILETLAQKMTLEIATLKASANIEHSKSNEKAQLNTNPSAGRIKVIEAIMEKLEEIGINPLINISNIIAKIERTSKGVISDLFKKQQHGGLREIYVLTLESRIVQLFIETISRVICSYFEEETLTHPKNKLKKLDEHRSNTARIANRENCIYADFCSSTDKTRWNQNLMMGALSIPLLRILPTEFHNIVSRILNMWTLKLIKLPQRVINLLINSVDITSETFKKLHQQFWNPSHRSIFNFKMSSFITLSSGMMQGILHYTSSLLHLTFLNSMNKLIPTLLKKIYSEHSFIMSQVCSSDDSATILTVFSPKNHRVLDNETYLICKKTSQMLETLNSMAPYYCMKNSVKSTTGLIDYVEFNSEFLFRNTIAIPIIKFVAASLNITESESFLERFHTMYNLISDLFSSGFPAENTFLCQLAQGYNHYKTMGSNVNPLFEYWAEDIVRIPDPILGFFLVDSEFCPGTLGFSYMYWKCATESLILRRSMKSLYSDAHEIIDGGGIVQSLILKHGEVKRWRTMVENMSKDINYKEVLNENPEILFREPSSLKELKVSLILKATMPSVAKSMRRGNPYMQALAMSVYAINTQCFSKTTITQDLTGKVQRSFYKTSLLRELNNRKKELTEDYTPITQELLEITFPAMERYKEAQKIIDDFKNYELVRCHRFRNRRSEVYVQPYSSFVPLSLLDVCKSLWFGQRVKTSGNILRRCINAYKQRLPWLSDTIKESLLNSPFNTYQELSNFVSSHSIKTRLFVRIGPGIYSKRFNGQLYHLIRKSQKECHVLKAKIPSGRRSVYKEYKGMAEIISKLSLSLSLPMKNTREENVKRILTTSPKLYDSVEGIQKMSKRDANLAYIQGFLKRDLSMNDITTSIQQTGNGLIFSYTKMQQKEETESGVLWKGYGECFVTCEKALILIKMKDDLATSVEVSSWKNMKANPSTMTLILRELNLKPIMSKTILMSNLKLMARFNGENWVPYYSLGIPIYENRTLSPKLREIEDVRLEISFQSINLTQNTPRGRASMIRFKTYPGDVLLNPCSMRGTSIADCWINQKSLDSEYGLAIILNIFKEKPPENIRFWLMETLLARLSQKGLTKGPGELSRWIPLVELEQQIQHIEVTDELLNSLADELSTLDVGLYGDECKKLNQNLPSSEDIENYDIEFDFSDEHLEGWSFAMHNWRLMEIEENVDITSRGIKTFKYLHPFWDDTIDNLENTFSGFWENVFKGHLVPGLDEASKAIIDLLGVKRREKPIGIEQKARLRIKEIVSQLESEPSPSTSGLQTTKREESPSWALEETSDDDEYFL